MRRQRQVGRKDRSPDGRRRPASPVPSCPPKAPTAGLWDFGGRETPKPSGPAAWCQSDWGHSRDRYEAPRGRRRMRGHGSAFDKICRGSSSWQSCPLAGVGWSWKLASDRRAGLLLSLAYLVLTLGSPLAPRNRPEPPTGTPADFTCPREKASVGTPTIARRELLYYWRLSGRPWGVSW